MANQAGLWGWRSGSRFMTEVGQPTLASETVDCNFPGGADPSLLDITPQ